MGSSMAQFFHQLHFQSKLFLKIVLGSSQRSRQRQQGSFRAVRRQTYRRQRSFLVILVRQSLLKAKSALSSVWLWGAIVLAMMLVWNWQLLLATVLGMGVLILLFCFPLDRWSGYWQKWQQSLDLSQKRLFTALAGSTLVGVGTYWALQLWDHMDNHWLAGGAIAQGVGIALLLGWQVAKLIHSPSLGNPKDQFSQLLAALSAEHPLQRLMAVRQLTQLAIQGKLHASQLQQMSEYFSLLFSVETEPILRQGLLESMQTLQLHHCWHKWETKTAPPLQKLQKVKKVPEQIQQF